ncbi:diguanylate cyclase [Sulfuricurvum sp.]|uniref:diguanylate cyclase n=1 Tax=Sulfuricurvum sp. TaxID=2025608 RepID=UPI002606789F|nr:diguanylate cyclase [Sulfuricurvum sp.]MDD2781508.1 diguanylate cyclase [Sulfuricurvum sp.]
MIYFVITLIMTITQIMIEYYDTKNNVQKDLVSLENTYINSLQNAIWDMDVDQIESLSDSISKLSFVKEVILLDPSGNIITHHQAHNITNRFSHEFNIYKVHNMQKIVIAKAIISSDQNSVIDIVKTGVILIILNAMIKSVILLFLFIWAFQKNLVEPLTDLTNQIGDIEFENLDQHKISVNVPKSSELDLLQKKFNLMIEKLNQQKNVILNAEHDYAAQLEQEVKERTLELEQLNIGLNHIATTDYLTNIRNRRSFFDVGDQYFVMAKRNQKELCVLSFDLDNFKAINDTYGHQVGDQALKQFADNCKKHLRESDIFGRMGGEEFTALLFETSLKESIHLAERIVKSTSEIVIHLDNEAINFTVSVGVASMLPSDQKMDDLLLRADRALYQAKANGRNQVISSEY